MDHARLRTPGGEDLVVLPKADYERLVEAAEMLADVAAYDAAKRDVDAGAETIPASVVNALIEGQNPVRVWRRHRGLTLAALAEAAGLSQAYVAQIESGARTGRAETLRKLALALSVDLEDLL